jgi:hypothetical protein
MMKSMLSALALTAALASSASYAANICENAAESAAVTQAANDYQESEDDIDVHAVDRVTDPEYDPTGRLLIYDVVMTVPQSMGVIYRVATRLSSFVSPSGKKYKLCRVVKMKLTYEE